MEVKLHGIFFLDIRKYSGVFYVHETKELLSINIQPEQN